MTMVMTMENNIEIISNILDYIETHLYDVLNLDKISNQFGYSKYHLHRMFTSVSGFTMHTYIMRRRINEAAYALVYSDESIMDIALQAGYQTQRSFHHAFKKLYAKSPHSFRKDNVFLPIQLPIDANKRIQHNGDMIQDIKMVDAPLIKIIGYTKSTRFGFHVIATLWRKLHAHKDKIKCRMDMDYVIGLHDYARFFVKEEKTPAFDYYAAAQVSNIDEVPNGMCAKTLPSSKYIVFSFHGRNEDSMQDVVEYIYQEWFPQSTCQLSDHNLYDFVKYGETIDEFGMSDIEYWVPVLSVHL